MQREISLHLLARQVCNLLDCHAACLLPGCPEPALQHPLLDLLPFNDTLIGASCPRGPVDSVAFLRHQELLALYDLAAQTGKVQRLAAFPAAAPFQSLAIIPLERAAGLLGFLLLLDERPDAFTSGDMLLLDCYLPSLLERLEKDLLHLANQRLSQQLSRLYRQQEVCQRAREETDRIDTTFLSMVMHELRTPLAAIKGYTALLQAYPLTDTSREEATEAVTMTPQRQQHYLATIVEQVAHLEALVRDLLDISRIHAGHLPLRCVPVDLAQLCQHVVELLQHRVRSQTISYDIRCVASPNLPSVWADPNRVQQVLTNLLENAINYSPGGGLIEVRVSAWHTENVHQGYLLPSASTLPVPVALRESLGRPALQVMVRDHGVGIAPEQQARLFKPFQRLEHPLTADVSGAGLGLYITRKIIQAMGGQITLQSRAGAGTTVSFTLPVHHPISTNIESQVLYGSLSSYCETSSSLLYCL